MDNYYFTNSDYVKFLETEKINFKIQTKRTENLHISLQEP